MNEKHEAIRKQMHEILDIVLDGNGFEVRKRELTGSLPTLFFTLWGHTGDVTVDLHLDGWESGRMKDKEWEFSYTNVNSAEQMEALKSAVLEAVKPHKKSDVLIRDIAHKEKTISKEKEALKVMKKNLRKALKEEGGNE